jgi:hypothetical protein
MNELAVVGGGGEGEGEAKKKLLMIRDGRGGMVKGKG